jgi:hypothetical protein
MIDFKSIIKSAYPERMEYITTVQGNPVWDYKLGVLNTIFLISNIQEGIEEEYVRLKELRKYIVSSEIPFDLVALQTEENNFELVNWKWNDENKELCLIYDINY